MSAVFKATNDGVYLVRKTGGESGISQEQEHTSVQVIVQDDERGGTPTVVTSQVHQSNSGNMSMDHDEKRMRRQIANSNERRRMQSINAGFQSLRNLLPHHEGEKLSKASILQQTAEYIYSLEQEKTRLLSQNCHLKRLLDQHDGASSGTGGSAATTEVTASGTSHQISLPKKRKLEGGIVVQTISDSSDEGLGSMSPEPVPVSFVTVVSSASAAGGKVSTGGTTAIQISAKEYFEMKQQLDAEKRQKARLEDQLRQLECQVYPERVHYQEVIEHTEGRDGEEMTIIEQPVTKMSLQQLKQLHAQGDMENVLLTLDSIPSVGQTQVVVCSPVGELVEENSRPISPSDLITPDDIKQEKIIIATTDKRPSGHLPQARVVSSILEAAIKAEPKVEVERIDGGPSAIVIEKASACERGGSPAPRMYVTNTSRQNLETIVEAIRHLEGDHLFEEVIEQDAPLALTTKQVREQQREREHHRKIQLEINPFLKFNTSSPTSAGGASAVAVIPASAMSNAARATAIQQQQINRPGVIVVKQNS